MEYTDAYLSLKTSVVLNIISVAKIFSDASYVIDDFGQVGYCKYPAIYKEYVA